MYPLVDFDYDGDPEEAYSDFVVSDRNRGGAKHILRDGRTGIWNKRAFVAAPMITSLLAMVVSITYLIAYYDNDTDNTDKVFLIFNYILLGLSVLIFVGSIIMLVKEKWAWYTPAIPSAYDVEELKPGIYGDWADLVGKSASQRRIEEEIEKFYANIGSDDSKLERLESENMNKRVNQNLEDLRFYEK